MKNQQNGGRCVGPTGGREGQASAIVGRMSDVVRLVGGPLDGTEMADPDPDSPDPGVWLVVPGWQARAEYAPMPGGDPRVWWYLGPVWI